MSGKKCKHCGSSDIEVDPARGDAVCTNCGSVLEDNIIVAEVEFQENAHGGASAIGQFVSADSKGGATGFGRAFNVGIGQESREVTLRKAREGITNLCQQLRLNQQCIDIACNFYKMALSHHLTIGRPANHTQAACVYMTCRTEGTPHLLIDVSDAVPICCYQLGRTYFKLARALCINVPPNDPCLYILRFASQLQFEEKQHEVSMTALRLVQRMKRDSIHSGRRPSGICGAALLIAGRLHDFNRTPADVVRIVKVHESTLRKRLLEFGDTPSSALTLDEFMTVDLEEEQDPPAFRAARKRDKDRLQKLMEEEDGEKELTELQREIELQIERDCKRRISGARSAPSTPLHALEDADDPDSEEMQASMFVEEDTMKIIGQLDECAGMKKEQLKFEKGLGPDLAVIGLGPKDQDRSDEKNDKFVKPEAKPSFAKDLHNAEDLVLGEKDEEYVDSFIMSDEETRQKTLLWNKINAGYLKQQKIKEEIRAKEKEENKNKKKTRGSYRKKVALNAATASEAVGKMLAERKISAKINYDILKSLDQPGIAIPVTPKPVPVPEPIVEVKTPVPVTIPESPVAKKKHAPTIPESPAKKRKKKAPTIPTTPTTAARPPTPAPTPSVADTTAEDYEDPDDIEDVADATESTELSLAAMLQNGQDDDYYDYEEY